MNGAKPKIHINEPRTKFYWGLDQVRVSDTQRVKIMVKLGFEDHLDEKWSHKAP